VSTVSLEQAISNALDRKKVPAFRAGEVGDLAAKLGLAHPVSLANLIQTLNNLPPAVATINIDTVSTPGGVLAYGQVGLQSDGQASFIGTVTNAKPEGINYVYSVALLDVKDSSGNVIVFYMSGNLFNLQGSSSTTLQQDGFSQFIANNWDAAKKSRYHAIIEASDNVFEDVLGAIAEAFLVVFTFGIVAVIPGGGGGGYRNRCEWYGESTDSRFPASLGACYRLK
jgi:hypothetical protein